MGQRSVWKGPFFELPLLQAIKADTTKVGVKTYYRSSTIIPAFVGAKLLVHNGKTFEPLMIREEMVGRKIGEFVATKKPWSFRQTNAHKKAPK